MFENMLLNNPDITGNIKTYILKKNMLVCSHQEYTSFRRCGGSLVWLLSEPEFWGSKQSFVRIKDLPMLQTLSVTV